jgi:hypothetical protein
MWPQSLEIFWTSPRRNPAPFRALPHNTFRLPGGLLPRVVLKYHRQNSVKFLSETDTSCSGQGGMLHISSHSHVESCGIMWNLSVAATESNPICFRSLISGTSTNTVHSQPVLGRSTVDEKHSAWRRRRWRLLSDQRSNFQHPTP